MDSKQRLRERIWRLLDAEDASRFPGARGRIPNFWGAEAAATRLAELPERQSARVVKSNPDAPQLPVRRRGGYSDLELALLVGAGLVDDGTAIATTVHPLQLLDEELPETDHDFRVDVVVTADEVVRTRARRRRPGVIWEHLDDDKIAAIPLLAARARR